MRLIKPIVLALAVVGVSAAQPAPTYDLVIYGGTSAGDHRGGAGQAHGQVGRHRLPRQASRRAVERRPRLHRHRQQVGDRRAVARVLPPRLAALRQARRLEVAEARGVRQQGAGHAGDRRRAADDVDLRAARRRAGLRGPGRRSTASRCIATSGSTARTGVRKNGARIAAITTLSGKTLRRQDVHRRDLRRRPDGRGRRRLPRRPRGAERLRREVERRADRRAAPPPSLRRAAREDQPLRRPRRSEERRAAAHQHRAARRVRARPTSASRPTATACA